MGVGLIIRLLLEKLFPTRQRVSVVSITLRPEIFLRQLSLHRPAELGVGVDRADDGWQLAFGFAILNDSWRWQTEVFIPFTAQHVFVESDINRLRASPMLPRFIEASYLELFHACHEQPWFAEGNGRLRHPFHLIA